MTDLRHYDVIVSPAITEKSTMASEQNQVVFNVAKKAGQPGHPVRRRRPLLTIFMSGWAGLAPAHFALQPAAASLCIAPTDFIKQDRTASHARGNAEYCRRDQAGDYPAEEASLTGIRP